MGRFIQLLVLAIAVFAIYRVVRGALRGALGGGGFRRSSFKCATCKNCKTLFNDGVLCAFGNRETFKNETHIANCHDHELAR